MLFNVFLLIETVRERLRNMKILLVLGNVTAVVLHCVTETLTVGPLESDNRRASGLLYDLRRLLTDVK